jgi:erythromycin esterase
MIKTFVSGLLLMMGSLTSFSQVNTIWQQWIKNNSHAISITDTNSFQDLAFLNEVLKDKNIVFLGENSHGVSEFTLLKSRMIRYLHQELGFDVLAFETNAADAYAANLILPSTDALTSIYNSISTLWHVDEIVPLFTYIKGTYATKNPLNIAGIDITMSNGSYSFSRLLYDLISPVNSTYAKEVLKSDSIFSRSGVRGWTIGNILSQEEKNSFKTLRGKQILEYSILIDFINKNKDKFPRSKSKEVTAAKFYLQSRIDYIYWMNKDSAYMADRIPLKDPKMNFTKLYSRYRDYMMSQNLKFLTETEYPGKKIIVWAQNAHISRRVLRMPADSSYSKFTYTIGLYCYSGIGDFYFGQAFDGSDPDSLRYVFKTPTDSNSIETILHSSNYNNVFVDMLHQDKSDGNSWMFELSKSTDWGGTETSEDWNIRSVFDGLILVNRISPPKYLKYDYEYLRRK